MKSTFQAVAFDFDGILADDGRLSATLRAALATARGRGLRLLLVTDRRHSAIAAVVPDVMGLFDAVVTEIGAVVSVPGRTTRLAEGFDERMTARLALLGLIVEPDQMVIAVPARYEQAVLHEIVTHGLGVTVHRNRCTLRLTPPGVSKGTGLWVAL